MLVGLLLTGASMSATLADAAASHSPRATRSKAGQSVLLTTRTVIPKVQRTVHFNGYATYTFSAPGNRRIVSVSARIVGAQAHAVKIASRALSRDRERYTVGLVFPGEQGKPGKLVVRIASVG
jgi:hypothetical protein